MNTEIVWVVGRYAFLGLLYLFVLLVLRALVAEMRSESVATGRPVVLPHQASSHDAEHTSGLSALVVPENADRASTPTPVEPLPPRLIVVESPDATEMPPGTAFGLTAVTTIGRGVHNSIALPSDKFASTNHALVFVRDGAVYLRDRGSTNGTLVNDQRAEDDVLLQDGDRIVVGTTVLRYSAGRTPPGTDVPALAQS